jgi:hypothetical protein
MRERRGECRVLVGRREGRRQLGRTGVDGKIILKLAIHILFDERRVEM